MPRDGKERVVDGDVARGEVAEKTSEKLRSETKVGRVGTFEVQVKQGN